MAKMPKIEVNVTLDDAIATLANIRNMTILIRRGHATDTLQKIHRIAQEALDRAAITMADQSDDD